MLEHQTAANYQDIVARVFKLKLHALLQDLYYGCHPVLGKMVALIYVIEWQNRGPPHAHTVGICDAMSKPHMPEEYGAIVCAEITPELHQILTSFMMHGPCGSSNPKSPCMEDGKCSKHFPKDFVGKTFEGNGYPYYRRTNYGRYIEKNGVQLDNRYVVPYNPYLSKKYHAYISVEICSSIKSCKYLYKYVYKGPDMASVSLQSQSSDLSPHERNLDEIQKYVISRFLSSSEGYWRIYKFDTYAREQSVQ